MRNGMRDAATSPMVTRETLLEVVEASLKGSTGLIFCALMSCKNGLLTGNLAVHLCEIAADSRTCFESTQSDPAEKTLNEAKFLIRKVVHFLAPPKLCDRLDIEDVSRNSSPS